MKARRKFTPEFNAKVALEAIRNELTTSERAARYEFHRGNQRSSLAPAQC